MSTFSDVSYATYAMQLTVVGNLNVTSMGAYRSETHAPYSWMTSFVEASRWEIATLISNSTSALTASSTFSCSFLHLEHGGLEPITPHQASFESQLCRINSIFTLFKNTLLCTGFYDKLKKKKWYAPPTNERANFTYSMLSSS